MNQCGTESVHQVATGTGTDTQALFMREQEQKGLDIMYTDLVKHYNDRRCNLEDKFQK